MRLLELSPEMHRFSLNFYETGFPFFAVGRNAFRKRCETNAEGRRSNCLEGEKRGAEKTNFSYKNHHEGVTIMMDVKLVIINGLYKGKEIKITRDVFEIGKSPKCQLNPGGTGVARHHCAIFRREGYAALKPLDLTFDTLINNKKVEKPQKLRNGDILQVGQLQFEVQVTVGVSGQKMSKVQSVSEAAARIAEKKSIEKSKMKAAGGKDGNEDDLDVFAIFGEDVPSEEELPSFITRKSKSEDEEVAEAAEDDELAKEKKVQESTRSAASDAIKAMLNQARKNG